MGRGRTTNRLGERGADLAMLEHKARDFGLNGQDALTAKQEFIGKRTEDLPKRPGRER